MGKEQKKDMFGAVRERMLKLDLKGRGITDAGVLEAMGQIRREGFVPREYYCQAYDDGPLPIGSGQTISQPYIVGLMTQELKVNSDCEVLEIGTGSGYQTAVLAKIVKRVYTIERLAELSESAQLVLGRLGIGNVEFCVGDGSCGWPADRIFERIIITAAVPKIPEPLTGQLGEGGLMVVPIGAGWTQHLVVCEKKKDRLVQREICGVRFVKLVGKYSFEQQEG